MCVVAIGLDWVGKRNISCVHADFQDQAPSCHLPSLLVAAAAMVMRMTKTWDTSYTGPYGTAWSLQGLEWKEGKVYEHWAFLPPRQAPACLRPPTGKKAKAIIIQPQVMKAKKAMKAMKAKKKAMKAKKLKKGLKAMKAQKLKKAEGHKKALRSAIGDRAR